MCTDELSLENNPGFNNTLTLIQHLSPAIQAEQEELQAIDDRTSRYREHTLRLRERIVNDEKQVDQLLSRLSDLKRSIKSVMASVQNLQSTRNSLAKQLDESKQMLNTSDTTQTFSDEFENSTLQQMCRMTAHFEQALGIRVERTKTGLLQIIFYGCSQRVVHDSGPLCFCLLKHTTANRFEVVKCNPPVSDLDRLVNHLNWTEDIRSFVIILRQRFCRYFELAAAISEKLGVK